MKTPERRQSYISYFTFFFVFLVNFEQVNAGWKEAALKYLTKYAENIHVLVRLQVKLQAVGMQRYQKGFHYMLFMWVFRTVFQSSYFV